MRLLLIVVLMIVATLTARAVAAKFDSEFTIDIKQTLDYLW